MPRFHRDVYCCYVTYINFDAAKMLWSPSDCLWIVPGTYDPDDD